MKKQCILYIVCLMFIISAAYAQIDIDNVDAYVNDESVSGVDKDGGDIDVIQGDDLEVNIRLENTKNTSIEVVVEGIIQDIDDGSDLTKDTTKTIKAEDDRSVRLFFNIPDDSRAGNYNMEITIDYTWNSTPFSERLEDYVIKVEKKEEEIEETINLQGSFDNLTRMCTDITNNINTCFGYIGRNDNLTDEISTCKEQRGTYKSSSEDCNEDLIDCKTERSNFETQSATLQNQIDARPTWATCFNQTNTKVKEMEKKKDNLYMGLGAAALVGWFLYNRRKRKQSVSDTYYYEKE